MHGGPGQRRRRAGSELLLSVSKTIVAAEQGQSFCCQRPCCQCPRRRTARRRTGSELLLSVSSRAGSELLLSVSKAINGSCDPLGLEWIAASQNRVRRRTGSELLLSVSKTINRSCDPFGLESRL